MAKDYYGILGVAKTATDEELKKAYHVLSKKYHPDVQHGKSDDEKRRAEEKFKEINEAYSILGDKEKRRQYDSIGTADFGGMGFGAGGIDPSKFFRRHFHDDFGDFGFGFGFGGGIHSGGRNPNAPKNGRDVQIPLEISFEEAIYGIVRDFDVKFNEVCDHCRGTGSDDGEMSNCETCGGTGLITVKRAANFIQSTTCPKCHGVGKFPKKVCHKCNGSKVVPTNHHIHIHIPAGVDNGDNLRVPGEGEHGINGGQDGDLYINLCVGKSKLFERDGDDLLSIVYVPAIAIGLVDAVEVETPWGRKSVDVPKTPSEDGSYRAILKGYGIRRKKNGTDINGNMVVFIVPEAISNMGDEQKELAKKLLDSLSDGNTPLKSKRERVEDEFRKSVDKFKK